MTKRGTTNRNVRGSAADRRARKWWLLWKFESEKFGAGWTHCYRCLALLCYATITVDRIVPGCRGGTYRRDNIRPACALCNSETGGAERGTIVPSERRSVIVKINEQVRQMHPPRYTRSQAAEAIGKDVDTLKRWSKQGLFRASDSKTFGQLQVALYTDDDLKRMREMAKNLKPGRKKSA